MKRNVLIIGAILILLASACAPQAAPTANPADIQHTAEAGAFTVVAETQAAIPTNTPVPPTDIPAPTALPTETPPPLPTSSTPGGLPTDIPTFTPQSPNTSSNGNNANNQDICNQPLTSWQGPRPISLLPIRPSLKERLFCPCMWSQRLGNVDISSSQATAFRDRLDNTVPERSSLASRISRHSVASTLQKAVGKLS